MPVSERLFKICSKCKELKSISEFYKNRTQIDGIEYYCKSCQTTLQRIKRGPSPKTIRKTIIETTRPGDDVKWCLKCNQWVDKIKFSNDKKVSDGLQSYCRACMNILGTVRYHNNPEKAAEKWKIYSSNNRLNLRANGREYYKNYIKPVLIQKAEIKKAEWEAKKPERLERLRLTRQIASSRYRARVKGNGGSHTIEEWEWIKFVQNNTCLMCGKSEPEIKLTQDHIVPIKKGGTDNIGNIQGLCGSCNSIKNSKFVDLRAKKFKKSKSN